MLAVFGWIVMLLGMMHLTAAWLLVCTQTLGKYNIGGVPTTVRGKVLTWVAGAGLALCWWLVIGWAPFVVVTK
jgi:hypothetical protein